MKDVFISFFLSYPGIWYNFHFRNAACFVEKSIYSFKRLCFPPNGKKTHLVLSRPHCLILRTWTAAIIDPFGLPFRMKSCIKRGLFLLIPPPQQRNLINYTNVTAEEMCFLEGTASCLLFSSFYLQNSPQLAKEYLSSFQSPPPYCLVVMISGAMWQI